MSDPNPGRRPSPWGWLLLIPCSAWLSDAVAPALKRGPLSGDGGSLGAWLTGWLETNFNPVGRTLIVVRER